MTSDDDSLAERMTAQETITREIYNQLKELRETVQKMSESLNSRMPLGATIAISVLSGLCGILATLAFR